MAAGRIIQPCGSRVGEPWCRWLLLHWSHTVTHTHAHLVELLWTSDRPVAETSTLQHATLTRVRYPCPRRVSNPQSQPASTRRLTPLDRAATGIDLVESCLTKCVRCSLAMLHWQQYLINKTYKHFLYTEFAGLFMLAQYRVTPTQLFSPLFVAIERKTICRFSADAIFVLRYCPNNRMERWINIDGHTHTETGFFVQEIV